MSFEDASQWIEVDATPAPAAPGQDPIDVPKLPPPPPLEPGWGAPGPFGPH